MKHKAHIIACRPLLHEFHHLTVFCPPLAGLALPGHYILCNHTPLYVLAADQEQLEFILPPAFAQANQNYPWLTFSDLQGVALAPPESDIFYLLLLKDQELNAGLFYLKKYRIPFKGLVFIGTQQFFPFQPCPSQKIIPGIPPHVIAALPLLEDWGIANRLASLHEQPGIFHGTVQELKKIWLQQAQQFPLYSRINILTPQQ